MWNENLEGITVVKRSGQRVNFNASKIAIAIKKAFDAVYANSDEKKVFKVFEGVLTYINENYKDRKTINVEDIQDVIEDVLKKQKCDEVYWGFHNYREKRAVSRMVFNEKQQHKFAKAIEIIEEENDYQNMNLTPDGKINKYGKIISSEYVKSYILDSKMLRALEEGSIYIHDLECLSLGYIPALHLKINIDINDRYLDKFVKEITDTSLEVANEIAIDRLDSLLVVPVLEYFKENMKDYLEKYLKVAGIYDFVPYKKYESIINRLDDINNVKEYLAELNLNNTIDNVISMAINDSRNKVKTYIEYIVDKILNIESKSRLTISLGNSNNDIAKNIKQQFFNYLINNQNLDNIHIIFKINNEDSDEDLFKISRLIKEQKNVSLSFVNKQSNNLANDVELFGNGMRVYDSFGGEQECIGRMACANTSINMARIALKSTGKNIDYFYEKLDSTMELAKNTLLLQFETLGNKYRENYKYLFRGNIIGDERLESGQKIRKIIKSGTLNIGLVGLKECICLLETDPEKQYKVLIKILEKMSSKCKIYQEESKLNFVLWETSGEAARQKLMGIDKSIYGTIKGITDKNVYSLLYELPFFKDPSKYSLINKYLDGGNVIMVSITKNTSEASIIKTIKEMRSSGVNFVKIAGVKT